MDPSPYTLTHGALSPDLRNRLPHTDGVDIGLAATAGSNRSFSHTSTWLICFLPIVSSRLSITTNLSSLARRRNSVRFRGKASTADVKFGWKKRGGASPSDKTRYEIAHPGKSGRSSEGGNRARTRWVVVIGNVVDELVGLLRTVNLGAI